MCTIPPMVASPVARCCWLCTYTWHIIAARPKSICVTKALNPRPTEFEGTPVFLDERHRDFATLEPPLWITLRPAPRAYNAAHAETKSHSRLGRAHKTRVLYTRHGSHARHYGR